jgi:hypothetical protein
MAAAGKKMRAGAACAAMAEETVSLAAVALTNLPTLLCALAVLSVCLALSGTTASYAQYLENQRKIKEYGIVVKNLERRYKVARVECLEQEGGKSRIAIACYDQKGQEVKEAARTMELPGTQIFLDSIVLNFAYSGIESGEDRNLALPYRVFTEALPQEKGFPLGLEDSKGLPYVYQRSAQELYGIEKADFDSRLADLWALTRDGDKARKAGIVRSVYGSAMHRGLKKGESFTLWIEQSGGLSVKADRDF